MFAIIDSEVFVSKSKNELVRGTAMNPFTGEQKSFIGDKKLTVGNLVDINTTGWANPYITDAAKIKVGKDAVADYKKSLS